MSWATSEVVTVLTFLLPGLVGATIFYSLTSHPKPSEIERIIHALAFTITAQAIASVVFYFLDLGWEQTRWPEFEEVVIPFGIAVVLALVAVIATNHDFPHKILRQFGFTRETSYPSEWYSSFHRYNESYVVLHLKGDRRLYGWPQEWPSRPGQGHFIIAEGEWLVDNTSVHLEGVSIILIPGEEVEMVEFMDSASIEPTEE